MSDAEPLLRLMLVEHGLDVPAPGDDEDEYRLLLHAFGCWDLPIHYFEGPFYVHVPAWDDQDPLDRTLVLLLDQRDRETAPDARQAMEDEMRAAVRRTLASD